VVLAAGRARRFGGAKLLAPLRGRPLLTHVLDTVVRARASGIVADGRIVLGAGDAELATLAASAGVQQVVNEAADRGLSSSLQCALAALGPDADAAMVLLGDQPLVRLDVLAALVGAWREGRGVVVRPRYAEAPDLPGHPVLLARAVWPLALELKGDAGLGAVFPHGAAGLALIDVAGRNPDVDTPADLDALQGTSS
jgi:molybdenum cofactor cytidylyltransferase